MRFKVTYSKMSGNKTYLIRRKVTKIEPSEIPKSLYIPETFVASTDHKIIKTTKYYENLSQPKQVPSVEVVHEQPKYEKPVPEYEPVDFRVNTASLYRDLYILNSLEKKKDEAEGNESRDYLEWQNNMKNLSEDEWREEIRKRKEDLEISRKKTIKAKEQTFNKRLESGKQIRNDFQERIHIVKMEIEKERQKIRELKLSMSDSGPTAVDRLRKRKLDETREMKRQIRGELQLANKLRESEYQRIKDNANRLREMVQNHTGNHGDTFKAKVDITDTKFLSSLTDEEVKELGRKNAEQRRLQIEQEIEKHRSIKEKNMNKLLEMLKEVTRRRELREEEHSRIRTEKKNEEEAALARRIHEEEEQFLELEKRIERKKIQRIKEAEEMAEHTMKIEARNRYLALNKKALQEKVFQSQQDGKLRAARERQESLMKYDCILPKTKGPTTNGDLQSLKTLLGV